MEKNYYLAAEDSRLLLDSILENFSILEQKNICEVGVGSGYVIKNLALSFPNNNFFGVDINEVALEKTKEEFNSIGVKIKLKKSNLFDKFSKKKFDLIFFNTPYLPVEDGEDFCDLPEFDRAIYGGEHGYETIENFILSLNDSLENSGVAFILFSSLSNKKYVEDVFRRNLFDFEYVGKTCFAFEEIYVVKISKSEMLREISSCNVFKLKYLDFGKHSNVLEGVLDKKNVIVKVGKFEHIQKEGMFLEKLFLEDFVPKILVKRNEFVVREKVNGEIILNFLNDVVSSNRIIKIFNKILEICFRLDELGINKFEMTNPYKHIFIDSHDNVFMIDYERCIYSNNPKNTTQFLQYIRRNIVLFKKKNIKISNDKILDISLKYKNKGFEFKFEDLFE